MIAAACNLSPALEVKYPDAFGGITISDNDSMINVYMTSMPIGLQSFVDSIAPPDAVTYVPCSNTIRAIWNVQLRIEAEDLQLAASGIDLVGFGANIADNSVDVDVYHLTAAQKSQLDQEFGAGLITQEVIAWGHPRHWRGGHRKAGCWCRTRERRAGHHWDRSVRGSARYLCPFLASSASTQGIERKLVTSTIDKLGVETGGVQGRPCGHRSEQYPRRQRSDRRLHLAILCRRWLGVLIDSVV